MKNPTHSLPYQSILEQSAIAMAVFDLHGNCVHITPTVQTLLGVEAHIAPSDIANLFEWPFACHTVILKIKKQPHSRFSLKIDADKPSQIIRSGKQGSKAPYIDVHINHIITENTAWGYSVQMIDTSANKEREKMLANYLRIYNLVVDPVCITDFAGNFVKVNPAFSKILGYPINVIEGSPMFNYIHPDDLQPTLDYIAQKIAEMPDLVTFENRYVCKDGSTVWLSWKVQPIYNEQIAFSIARDVTQLKKIEAELILAKEKAEESDHLKTAFICNMSHEIRTPMNGIIGLSDIISQSELPEDERLRYADIINDSCQQLLHIVNDIIDISKIETGQIQLHDSLISINGMIKDLHSFYAPTAKKRNLSLQSVVSLPDHESRMVCDHTKLRQILDNLVNNAMKFTQSGHVKFGYTKEDDHLRFFVEDTGIGIPPAFTQTIFERFRQADDHTEQVYGGTGLGLSISKAYIEKMGGTIWFRSNPSGGTTFFFTMPIK